MTEYHEPPEELDARARDFHRALTSLKEEIEAVDWYAQRVARATSPELRRVLDHNRREEIEHACMTLEWLRREDPEWDSALRTYLNRKGDIVKLEEAEAPSAGRRVDDSGVGLGVGSLREVAQ